MNRIGYYNGIMGNVEEIQIPMQDRALFFGDGVYDFTFAFNKKMFAIEDHLDRFENSLRLMEIDPPMEREELKKTLQKCVDAADSDEGLSIYWQTSRGNCARNHIFPPKGTPSTLLITISPLKKLSVTDALKLITIEDTRFFHCNIKTLNLIPNVMAAQRAEEAGCQEAVFHRGSNVTECAHSSLVILKDQTLIAPPLDELILPSISRKHAEKLCKDLNIPVIHRRIDLNELYDADELVVLSSSKLIKRADTLDGKAVGMKDAATYLKIQNAYFDYVKEETGHWMGE